MIVLDEFSHSHVHWLFATWEHEAQVSFWDATEETQPCPQDRAMYKVSSRSHNGNIPLC